MALTQTQKVLAVVVGTLLVLAGALGIGLGLGYGTAELRKGIYLEFSPKPPQGSLIQLKGSNQTQVRTWTDIIDSFLYEYKHIPTNEDEGRNIYSCSFEHPSPPGKYCDVDIRGFGPCAVENHYQYNRYSPCVFLRPNKVLNWVPETYSSVESLPANMSAELKDYISKTAPEQRNMIWVSCEGETPADIEYIGPIKYYPTRGFPVYFYPYSGVNGYLSPIIAIQLERPTTGVLINVECKLWAKNIPFDRDQDLGSAHFQLLMD